MSSGGFFFQAEDGIRYLVRSRGLGDVYKRQGTNRHTAARGRLSALGRPRGDMPGRVRPHDILQNLSLIHI